MTNRLREIEALGQAVWIDNIYRGLLEDGILQRLVEDDGITGVTSNPTIFEKAIGGSDRYDEGFAARSPDRDDPGVFFRLAFQDIRDAADVLHGVYDETEGRTATCPSSCRPSWRTTPRAPSRRPRCFCERIGRPNVLIKVPGTAEGVEAFEELTAAGVSST